MSTSSVGGIPLPSNWPRVYSAPTMPKSKAPESGRESGTVAIPIWALSLGLTGVFVVVAALCTLYFYDYLPLMIKSEVQTQVAPITDRLIKVETQLELLPRDIPAAIMRLPGIIKNARTDEQKLQAALQAATQIMEDAKSQRADVTLASVKETGAAILHSPDYPSASKVRALALSAVLNYRSFLTAQEVPQVPGARPVVKPTDFDVQFTFKPLSATTRPPIILFDPEMVSGADGALLTGIGRESTRSRPRYLIVEGANFELDLDGYHLRNVIVRDARIVYNGGPVLLENVFFVNCTFEIEEHDDRGKVLTDNIISDSGITFKNA